MDGNKAWIPSNEMTCCGEFKTPRGNCVGLRHIQIICQYIAVGGQSF